MYRPWIQLFVFLGGFVVPSVLRVSGLEVYMSADVEAANGTNVKLKCTFASKHPVLPRTLTVSWNFRPLHPGPEESVFHYQEAPYPPTSGRFKGHAVWSGDILRNDASITLHEVLPSFNGTYICQVRNMPDLHGMNGEVVLKVVKRVALSEIAILGIVVGGAIGVVLVLLGIFVALKFSRRRHPAEDAEHAAERSREQEWKDPTVCKPEEAVHLKLVEKEKEVESSDEESEASSGGDEEEEGGEEDDDDDDDDDDDGGDDDDD